MSGIPPRSAHTGARARAWGVGVLLRAVEIIRMRALAREDAMGREGARVICALVCRLFLRGLALDLAHGRGPLPLLPSILVQDVQCGRSERDTVVARSYARGHRSWRIGWAQGTGTVLVEGPEVPHTIVNLAEQTGAGTRNRRGDRRGAPWCTGWRRPSTSARR